MTTRLRDTLSAGRFAVTAELGLPAGVDAGAIAERAGLLRGWVDAVNITDNPSARVMPSAMAAGVLVANAGVEPVVQLTCRDRNRIALQSDLLGLGLLGIPNVLLLTGDHPRFGDHPEAAPVFDLDGPQLVWLARTLRDEGRLLSGRVVDPAPDWLIGTVENPFAPPTQLRADRLAKKAAAGAEFVQTQFVFDVPVFSRWMEQVRSRGVDIKVLAGVGPIRSLRALEFLRHRVPGVHVPDEVERRLRAVPADRVAEEGLRLCVETIDALAELPGVNGIHIMAFGFERGIPELLERSTVSARRAGLPEQVPSPNGRPH